jgi:hypothetical protein
MTFFAAIAVLFLAATTLLVFAGREFLRINKYPPHRVHDVGDIVHLASLGYAHLNKASEDAARRRIANPGW